METNEEVNNIENLKEEISRKEEELEAAVNLYTQVYPGEHPEDNILERKKMSDRLLDPEVSSAKKDAITDLLGKEGEFVEYLSELPEEIFEEYQDDLQRNFINALSSKEYQDEKISSQYFKNWRYKLKLVLFAEYKRESDNC